MDETRNNIRAAVNSGRQFVLCTKVTVPAHQELKEQEKLSKALELRDMNIPHYFVLGKQSTIAKGD